MSGEGAGHPRAAAGPPDIVLVGFRGCGKTSAARGLGQRLGRPAVDTDSLIEEQAGCSVREIFARLGEAAFRAMESRVLEEVIGRGGQVISVGGGAVLLEANRRVLRRGVCVWLRASAEELARRLAADERSATLRPALTALPPEEEVRRLLAVREPLYREVADAAVDTEGKSAEDIIRGLMAVIETVSRGRTDGS